MITSLDSTGSSGVGILMETSTEQLAAQQQGQHQVKCQY